MKSVSKREKIMLIILIVCVIFYGYYRLFLNPVLIKTTAVKDNINKYNAEITKLQQAAVLNEKLKLELNELNVKFQETVKILPQYEKDPEIAYNLKGLGDKNSIVLNNVSIAQPTELVLNTAAQNGTAQTDANSQNKAAAQNPQAQPVQSQAPKLYIFPVNISTKGAYSSIKGFISSIENDTRAAEVSSVNLSVDQTGSIIGTIGINYYYFEGLVKGDNDYSFNKGTFGKQDLFK